MLRTTLIRKNYGRIFNNICRKFKRQCSTTGTVESAPVTEAADVVIIGGGIIGCSILYQLAKRGRNVILCERNKLTSGTSWHAAGLVWSLRPTELEINTLKATKDVFKELGEENVGWINNGSLFLAHSDFEIQKFKELHALGEKCGIESHIIGGEDTKELFPLLDTSAFKAALYSPGDGFVDPSQLCNALIKSAKTHGAKVLEDCDVTNIFQGMCQSTGTPKVTGVLTSHGKIQAKHVVNARGLWSQQNIDSVNLPFTIMKHTYVVTEPLNKTKRLPNIRDHDRSIYFRVQGQSLLIGGYEDNPTIVDQVPDDFQFQLYDMNWTTFEPLMRNASRICPTLKNIGIKSTICGPEAFSIDRRPIVGPDPKINGLFHSCGFSSNGFMLSGCAEQIAEWIVRGKPRLDMTVYDLKRFDPTMTSNREWVKQKCTEMYVGSPSK